MAGDRWKGWSGGDLVFTTPVGTPLDSPNLTKRFQKTLAEAGLPRIRFHDLRGPCASFMAANGENMRVVMGHLGHAQASTTLEIYAQVIPEQHRAAAGRMEALLTGSDS